MGLADDLDAINERTATYREVLDSLDPKDREAVFAKLDDPKVAATDLAAVLKRHGIPLSAFQIRRYRSAL